MYNSRPLLWPVKSLIIKSLSEIGIFPKITIILTLNAEVIFFIGAFYQTLDVIVLENRFNNIPRCSDPWIRNPLITTWGRARIRCKAHTATVPTKEGQSRLTGIAGRRRWRSSGNGCITCKSQKWLKTEDKQQIGKRIHRQWMSENIPDMSCAASMCSVTDQRRKKNVLQLRHRWYAWDHVSKISVMIFEKYIIGCSWEEESRWRIVIGEKINEHQMHPWKLVILGRKQKMVQAEVHGEEFEAKNLNWCWWDNGS